MAYRNKRRCKAQPLQIELNSIGNDHTSYDLPFVFGPTAKEARRWTLHS